MPPATWSRCGSRSAASRSATTAPPRARRSDPCSAAALGAAVGVTGAVVSCSEGQSTSCAWSAGVATAQVTTLVGANVLQAYLRHADLFDGAIRDAYRAGLGLHDGRCEHVRCCWTRHARATRLGYWRTLVLRGAVMYWLAIGVVLLAMGLGIVALDRRVRRSVGAPEEPARRRRLDDRLPAHVPWGAVRTRGPRRRTSLA